MSTKENINRINEPFNEGHQTISEELEQLAPSLSSMKKANPFVLPENYFDHLEYKVMERIKAEKPTASAKTASPQISLRQWWDTNMAVLFTWRIIAPIIASVLVLGISLNFMHSALSSYSSSSPSESGLELSGLSDNDLSKYIVTHSEEFDLNDVDPQILNEVAENYEIKDGAPVKPSAAGQKDKAVDELDDQLTTEEVLWD